MTVGDPVSSLAAAYYSALIKDLPEVEYRSRKPGEKDAIDVVKTRRPRPEECECRHFPQTWSDTSLGFGGAGGQTITSAYTTVVIEGRNACVYFAGGLAYKVERPGPKFWIDLQECRMASRADARGRYND